MRMMKKQMIRLMINNQQILKKKAQKKIAKIMKTQKIKVLTKQQ